jgi:ketosteroid isomerase-like protein
MPTPNKTLIELETKFWQSLVDQDTDAALEMLSEPALMVSEHGAMKFDHDGYRKMADNGPRVLTSFQFSDMEVVFPNDSTAILTYHVKQAVAQRGDGGESTVQEMNDTSTWVKNGNRWECVIHTETPAVSERAAH